MKVEKSLKLFIVLALFLFASCNKNNDIVQEDKSLIFQFQRSGGWVGLNEKMEINTDSTHYVISYHELGASETTRNYQTTIKTSATVWNNLVKTFNVETFAKIQDGPCSSCVDGYDEIFSVTQDTTHYSFYNGGGDENFQQMQDFFNIIYEQLDFFENQTGFNK